jgi:hypothetical protein
MTGVDLVEAPVENISPEGDEIVLRIVSASIGEEVINKGSL